MQWAPHEYQERAIALLLSQGAGGLLLDPGLGKTSIVLASFLLLKEQGLAKKMLVIAPLRPMALTWPSEIRKWDTFNSLTYQILHGKDKDEALKAEADIYLINPEGLKWFAEKKGFEKFKDQILCVDESTKFKAHGTARFKILKDNLDQFNRRWILTGTPTPNGLMDLFSQVYILDSGRALGRYITHYRNKFFFNPNPFDPYTWAAREGAFDAITDRISPLTIRLRAEDYLKMPKLVDIDVPVELTDEAWKVYREVEDEFFTVIEDNTVVADNAAVAGGKCRQIANGALYYNNAQGDRDWSAIHTGKLDALESLVGEINSPIIIFYEFNHDRFHIESRFGPLPTFTGLSEKKQLELLNYFNEGRVPLLLGHPASMGHGLNLQGACHHLIWFGLPWNLEHYQQAVARVYRQGQTSDTVFNYRIFAKGTLDEKVGIVLTKKQALQETILRVLQERGSK